MGYRQQLEIDCWSELRREVRDISGWKLRLDLVRNRPPYILFTHKDGRKLRLWDVYITADGHIQNCIPQWCIQS